MRFSGDQPILLNNGSGTFSASYDHPFFNAPYAVTDIQWGDLDGDGDVDAFIRYETDAFYAPPIDPFTIWLNEPGATLYHPPSIDSTTDITILEEGPPVPLGPVTLSDTQDGPLSGLTLSIPDNDGVIELAYSEADGISGVWDSENSILTLSGEASTTAYEAAVGRVTARHLTDYYPPAGSRTTVWLTPSNAYGTGRGESMVITVTGINDAPILNDTDILLPPAFAGETTTFRVYSILDGSDPDRPGIPLMGAAITGLTGNGLWEWREYTTNSWKSVSAVSDSSALLLDGSDDLRYTPVAGGTGETAAITFRAWDRTNPYFNGSYFKITGTGGTTAFSAAEGTATLPVIGPLFTPFDAGKQLVGDGTFPGSEDVALFDMDGDGDADALVSALGATGESGTPGRMENWINDGRGGFTLGAAWTPFSPGQGTNALEGAGNYRIAAGDLDGDGDVDVALGHTAGNLPLVYLNDGAGTFRLSSPLFPSASLPRTVALEMADFNGDSHLDLFYLFNDETPTGIPGGSSVERTLGLLWVNDGAGNFTLSPDVVKTQVPVTDLAVGDLDGDGDVDLLVATHPGGADPGPLANQLWLNNGEGRFTRNNGQSFGDSLALSAALGDVDNDGDLDLFLNNDGVDASRLWLNDGLGGFTVSDRTFSLPATHLDAAFGDVNDDGFTDLYVTSRADGDALDVLFLNDGTGAFFSTPGGVLGIDPSYQGNNHRVRMADLDGDGDLDLFLGSAATSPHQVLFSVSKSPLPPPSPPPAAPPETVKEGTPANGGEGVWHHGSVAAASPVPHHLPADHAFPMAERMAERIPLAERSPLAAQGLLPPGVDGEPTSQFAPLPTTSTRERTLAFMDDMFGDDPEPDPAFSANWTPLSTPLSFRVPLRIDGLSLEGRITLEVTRADGSPLPDWLDFDAATGTFSGRPDGDFDGVMELLVIRRDSSGNQVQELLRIEAEEDPPAQEVEHGEAAPETTPNGEKAVNVRLTPSNPGLSTQLRQAQRARLNQG